VRQQELLRAKQRERRQIAGKLAARTKKGQPVMKNMVQHLLDKLQKGAHGGKKS